MQSSERTLRNCLHRLIRFISNKLISMMSFNGNIDMMFNNEGNFSLVRSSSSSSTRFSPSAAGPPPSP